MLSKYELGTSHPLLYYFHRDLFQKSSETYLYIIVHHCTSQASIFIAMSTFTSHGINHIKAQHRTSHYSTAWLCFILYLGSNMGLHNLIFMGRNLDYKKKLTPVWIMNSLGMDNMSIVNDVGIVNIWCCYEYYVYE